MTDARQRLRLMQLASSSLPVGSFTWSQGLEWAVEIGWVKNAEDFAHWQTQQLEQNFFTVDLPIFARLYHACERNDVTAARRWSAYLLACRETRELREEERSRGRRLHAWWWTGCRTARRRGVRFCRQPALRYGVAGRALAHPADGSGVKPRLQLVRKRSDGGVKLVPFGQQAAQQLILSLCDHYAQGMAQALARPDADLGSSTPLAAIASVRHETQYCRLFRS